MTTEELLDIMFRGTAVYGEYGEKWFVMKINGFYGDNNERCSHKGSYWSDGRKFSHGKEDVSLFIREATAEEMGNI